jgi:hypothetical protein
MTSVFLLLQVYLFSSEDRKNEYVIIAGFKSTLVEEQCDEYDPMVLDDVLLARFWPDVERFSRVGRPELDAAMVTRDTHEVVSSKGNVH